MDYHLSIPIYIFIMFPNEKAILGQPPTMSTIIFSISHPLEPFKVGPQGFYGGDHNRQSAVERKQTLP